MVRIVHALLVALACVTLCQDVLAADEVREVRVTSRDELIRALRNARPGTVIRIAPGTYRGGLSASNLQGTKEHPIVVTALDKSDPPHIVGEAVCLHLRRPAYVQLRHLVLRDARVNGLNIDDGHDPERPAQHITLDHLHVRDIGARGNNDGIKLSGVDHVTMTDCTVERWGDSGSAIDMVGCHDGVIHGCVFTFRSDNAANGVQTKGGSARIVIRRCRFNNAGGRAVNIGGSTGDDYFRPHDASFEARDITVEDCTLIGSMAPIVFVGVDGATVRHNTLYRPGRWIVRILQESDGPRFVRCRNGTFENNVIVFRSDEVRTIVNVGANTAPESFAFSGNYWYCLDNPGRSGILNLPVRETDGHYGEDPQLTNAAEGDLTFAPSSPVRNAGVRPSE